MLKLIPFAVVIAALLAVPVAAFSQEIGIGPDGLRLGSSERHHEYRRPHYAPRDDWRWHHRHEWRHHHHDWDDDDE